MKKIVLISLFTSLISFSYGQNIKMDNPDVILLDLNSETLRKELKFGYDFLFLKLEESDTSVVEMRGNIKTHKGLVYSNTFDSIGEFEMKQADLIYHPTYIEFVLIIDKEIYTIHYTGYHQISKANGVYFEINNDNEENELFPDWFVVKKGKLPSNVEKQLK